METKINTRQTMLWRVSQLFLSDTSKAFSNQFFVKSFSSCLFYQIENLPVLHDVGANLLFSLFGGYLEGYWLSHVGGD